MDLKKGRHYFISITDAVLRAQPKKKSKAKNHLLFGDWLKYLGEEKNGWAKVKCRGDRGWLRKTWFSAERVLEVNFVDIGQGDGCHIVTPDDKVIRIDAGIGDNMFRFVNWRYNLRGRKVIGVDGVTEDTSNARQPFEIDHVIISHPIRIIITDSSSYSNPERLPYNMFITTERWKDRFGRLIKIKS